MLLYHEGMKWLEDCATKGVVQALVYSRFDARMDLDAVESISSGQMPHFSKAEKANLRQSCSTIYSLDHSVLKYKTAKKGAIKEEGLVDMRSETEKPATSPQEALVNVTTICFIGCHLGHFLVMSAISGFTSSVWV